MPKKAKYEKESGGFILLNVRTYYESHCNQINILLKQEQIQWSLEKDEGCRKKFQCLLYDKGGISIQWEKDVLSRSVMSDFSIPWTVAHQAPLSMGILQARILEWVAMPSSRGSSQARDQTQSLAFQADFLPAEPPGKPRKRMDYLIIWCYWWIHNWWILWREYNRTPILCHIQT